LFVAAILSIGRRGHRPSGRDGTAYTFCAAKITIADETTKHFWGKRQNTYGQTSKIILIERYLFIPLHCQKTITSQKRQKHSINNLK
jgi:hypothetical protein